MYQVKDHKSFHSDKLHRAHVTDICCLVKWHITVGQVHNIRTSIPMNYVHVRERIVKLLNEDQITAVSISIEAYCQQPQHTVKLVDLVPIQHVDTTAMIFAMLRHLIIKINKNAVKPGLNSWLNNLIWIYIKLVKFYFTRSDLCLSPTCCY